VSAGRRPAVVFEMFTADDQPAIDRQLAAAPGDAAGVADAVDWKRSGWPDWAMYEPLVDVALQAGLRIRAGNLSHATLAMLRRGGVGALEPALRARLGLDRALSGDVRAAVAVEIRESHCGHASERMLDRMIDIQRARDAHLADALLGAPGDGAVLIAGSGHVRTDRGVPAYLAARHPGPSVASVAFLEVQDGATSPAAYAARFGAGGLPFDYVWFTPRVDDEDPCDKFRKSLETLRQPPQEKP